MNKKLIIGILVIFALGAGGWVYLSQYKLFIPPPDYTVTQPENIILVEKTPPLVHILSDRTEKFSVSSGDGYPIFTKQLIADPFKVKEGEEQYFSIWTKDPDGIEKVIATIQTDKEDEILELELAEGTEQEGRWQCLWQTKNIGASDSYSTEFQIINKNDKDRKSTFFWYLLK
jgi:hypothetical protein